LSYEETLRLKLELDSTDIGASLSGVRQSVADAVSNLDIQANGGTVGSMGATTGGNPNVDANSIMWGLGIAAKQMAGDVGGLGSHIGIIGGAAATGLGLLAGGAFDSSAPSSGVYGMPGGLSGMPLQMGIFDPMQFSMRRAIGLESHIGGLSQVQSQMIADDPSLVGGLGMDMIGMEALQTVASVGTLFGGFAIGQAGFAGLGYGVGAMAMGLGIGAGLTAAADYLLFDPIMTRMGSAKSLSKMLPDIGMEGAYDILGGGPMSRAFRMGGDYGEITPEWMSGKMDTRWGEMEGTAGYLMNAMSSGVLSRDSSTGMVKDFLMSSIKMEQGLNIGQEGLLEVRRLMGRGRNIGATTADWAFLTSGITDDIGLIDAASRGPLSAALGVQYSLHQGGLSLDGQHLNAQYLGGLLGRHDSRDSGLMGFLNNNGINMEDYIPGAQRGIMGLGRTPGVSNLLMAGALMSTISGGSGIGEASSAVSSGGLGALSSAIMKDPSLVYKAKTSFYDAMSGNTTLLLESASAMIDLIGKHAPGVLDTGGVPDNDKIKWYTESSLIEAGVNPRDARITAEELTRERSFSVNSDRDLQGEFLSSMKASDAELKKNAAALMGEGGNILLPFTMNKPSGSYGARSAAANRGYLDDIRRIGGADAAEMIAASYLGDDFSKDPRYDTYNERKQFRDRVSGVIGKIDETIKSITKGGSYDYSSGMAAGITSDEYHLIKQSRNLYSNAAAGLTKNVGSGFGADQKEFTSLFRQLAEVANGLEAKFGESGASHVVGG